MSPALRPALAAIPLILALAGCGTGSGARISAMTPLTGPVSGGTTVSITGAALQSIAAAKVGDEKVPVDPNDDGTKATFIAPAASDFADGAEDLELLDSQGKVIHQAEYDYTVATPVDRQLRYALAHWKNYNTADFETLGDDDCVNFTSQTLLARGWKQDDEWFYDPTSVYDSSSAWRSSTGFRDWLETRPDLATPIDDSRRDQVVPGDIVQFDWDQSGDRDHTGIVTRVERTATGTKIAFAGHTVDSDYRDVDAAITVDHPGGAVYYWHLGQ